MKEKGLMSVWTSHLKTNKEREDFSGYVRNSGSLLERLTTIIKDRIDELDCPSKADYDNSAWPYKAADRNGQLRVYREMLKLTNLS
jgi:hypothetical protein